MTTTETCPVHLDEGLHRAGDDREFFRELLQMFAEEASSQVERLGKAVESGDLQQVVRIAHCLKGAASNLAAGPVSEAALELETAARDRGGDEIAPLARRLEEQLEVLYAFIREFE
ncbi:MAG: Hpt domain-containing protein [Acidobacteriota bacterium]|nr:Hpt domain-containing protein [Acidobacteriota bacterium]